MNAEWQYEPLQDIDKTLAESLRDFPREPHLWMYGLRLGAAFMLRSWLRLVHGFHVVGRENLPATGSFLMVANHASHWDALGLLSALPLSRIHRAYPAAAADYFFTDLPRSAISAVVVNAMPFNRRASGGRESLALCRRVLEGAGNVLILFPEGTRSTDGSLGAFKAGVGLLLAGSSTPVLPCYLHGAYASWPRQRGLPRPSPLHVTIGAPRSYRDRPPSKESALFIADDLRAAVEQLGAGA